MAKTFYFSALFVFLLLLPLTATQITNSSSSSIPTEKSSSQSLTFQANDTANLPKKTSEKSIINSGQLSFLANLLTKTYPQLVPGQSSSAQTSNVDKQALVKALKQLQKEVTKSKQVENNQNNTENSSNIDNGKNNTINGTKNVIHQGNNNQIQGVGIKVNGSNNSVTGKHDFVRGNDNVVMDSPLDINSILSVLQGKSENAKANKTTQNGSLTQQSQAKEQDNFTHNSTKGENSTDKNSSSPTSINKTQDTQQNRKSNQSQTNSNNQGNKKSDNQTAKANSTQAKTFNLNTENQSLNQKQTKDQKTVQPTEKSSAPAISQNGKNTNVSLGQQYILKYLGLCLMVIMLLNF